MKLSGLFKVSLVATAISLAGCGGGDININVDETVEQPTTPTNPTTPPTTDELPGVFSQSLSNEVSAALGRDVTKKVKTEINTKNKKK